MIEGVYTYDIPAAMTGEIRGMKLTRVTEEPESYRDYQNANDVSVLITRQGSANRMLEHFPNVKWLQLLNAGYELVDLELLRSRNILFTNASSVYCSTIAEDVLAKMLILARNYHRHFIDQQNTRWPEEHQLVNNNIDLEGKTLAIFGAGCIGKSIARLAQVFGLHVIGYDPYVAVQEGFDEMLSDLSAAFQQADFLVTSLPVTEKTRGMINEDTLALMKPGAFLINVARGEIVDEEALCNALRAGTIRGAAIDVAKQEPLPPSSPLWQAPNLLITPHTAAFGDQMKKRMCSLIHRNALRYLANKPLENRVNL